MSDEQRRQAGCLGGRMPTNVRDATLMGNGRYERLWCVVSCPGRGDASRLREVIVTHQFSIPLLAAFSLCAAVSACSRSQPDKAPETKAEAPSATVETTPPPVPKQVVLNGCLQEGTRGIY